MQAGAVRGPVTRQTPFDNPELPSQTSYTMQTTSTTQCSKRPDRRTHDSSGSRHPSPHQQTRHTHSGTPHPTKLTKKGAAERLCDAHEHSGGVHEQISYDFWKRATTSRYSNMQSILRARFDRLMPQKRRSKVLPVGQRATSAICQHCWKEFQLTVEGDAQHEINECRRPVRMTMKTKRHDEALKAIHVAVARAPTAAATCRRICHELWAFCAWRMLRVQRRGRYFHRLLGQVTVRSPDPTCS